MLGAQKSNGIEVYLDVPGRLAVFEAVKMEE